VLCAWCDEPATWVLVTDADLHNHDHPSCDPHREAWMHLYRRAVAITDVGPDVSPDAVVDVRDRSVPTPAALDLRGEDEPVGRHER
jgi:hypothetical protein